MHSSCTLSRPCPHWGHQLSFLGADSLIQSLSCALFWLLSRLKGAPAVSVLSSSRGRSVTNLVSTAASPAHSTARAIRDFATMSNQALGRPADLPPFPANFPQPARGDRGFTGAGSKVEVNGPIFQDDLGRVCTHMCCVRYLASLATGFASYCTPTFGCPVSAIFIEL